MIIQRKDYIDKINPFVNEHIIKVLIGTRRSGKSTILKQIIDSLIKQGIPEENIVWMNFELSDYFEIDNIKKLEEFISHKKYFFTDESECCNSSMYDDEEKGISGSRMFHRRTGSCFSIISSRRLGA